MLLLEVGGQVYGEGKKEVEGSEGEKIEVSKDEFNALRLRVTQLEEENGKLKEENTSLKSELDKTKSELGVANNRIKELEIEVNNNVGMIIENFQLKAGYNHYDIGFEPSFVFMELDNGYTFYGKKGDKNQYYAYVQNNYAEFNPNCFDTDSTGFWMKNGDSVAVMGKVYIVK